MISAPTVGINKKSQMNLFRFSPLKDEVFLVNIALYSALCTPRFLEGGYTYKRPKFC